MFFDDMYLPVDPLSNWLNESIVPLRVNSFLSIFMQEKSANKEKVKTPGRVLPQLATVIYLHTGSLPF